MTRRYTGAEARELAAKAAPGPWVVRGRPECGSVWGSTGPVAILRVAAGPEDAALAMAAPDLAESLAVVEAERDALRALVAAYGQAHDARTAHSRRYDAHLDVQAPERELLNDAVSAALAALREAAK